MQSTTSRRVYLALVIFALLFAFSSLLVAVTHNNGKALDAKNAADNAERLARRIDAEALLREGQFCEILEGQQNQNVERLKNTYDYLVGLNQAQMQEPLNKLVLRNLKQTEEAAKTDPSPDYCDKPNVGLPEPDPQVPDRPAALKQGGDGL